MRRRITEGEQSYYVKIPTDDGTSITKRKEYKYPNCRDLSEFVSLATSLLKSENILLEDNLQLTEGVNIKTERHKVLVRVQDSIIEIACDFSTYKYGEKVANGYMLECELKEGDDISLWYLTKHLKQFGFVETNESKKKQAQRLLAE